MEHNYENYPWYNQTINGKSVNFVRVRVFKKSYPVTSEGQTFVTDGYACQKSRHSFVWHISDYSYVILSSGIRERSSIYSQKPHLYLHLKVYLAEDFQISTLEKTDFLGKSYVIKALKKEAISEPFLPPLLDHLRKKDRSNYENLYNHLKTSAQQYELDTVEQLFQEYQVSSRYQALFWKELYEETEKK